MGTSSIDPSAPPGPGWVGELAKLVMFGVEGRNIEAFGPLPGPTLHPGGREVGQVFSGTPLDLAPIVNPVDHL